VLVSWLLDRSRDIEIALAALAATLVVALVGLALWRGFDELRFLRRQRLIARYRPIVDVLLSPAPDPDIVQRLAGTPRRHRPILADLLLSGLRLTKGEVVPRLRDAAAALGLVDRWTERLDHRRWWVRAEAARALGLVREAPSVDALLQALDDPHEEVRAAAVDALGRIGDSRCGPALLARLRDESRHQRARVVEALRALGPSMVPMLLTHARERPSDTPMTLDILGIVGGTAAIDTLLEWSGAGDPAVRAAALRAIGSIGLDDRSFFYALRGLEDDNGDVRAMAARALGRSGRHTAVPYLSAHLNDEWLVAAHCATGLRRLGLAGAAALQTQAESTGQGAELARQMLWELTFLKAGA
jgi:HEAT repeat protein